MKSKEAIVDLIKETTRNSKNVFIRIFPSKLLPKYDRFLEHSPNWTVYKQLYNFIFSNKLALDDHESSKIDE
jgi:hypothetical protein